MKKLFLLLLLLLLLLPLTILIIKINKQNSTFIKDIKDYINTKSIVVSHCSENLKWLNNFSNNWDIYVYTKCKKEINTPMNSNIKIIELPNSGGCDHTYLYHIVNNWNNLTDYIAFTTGNPFGKRDDKLERIR